MTKKRIGRPRRGAGTHRVVGFGVTQDEDALLAEAAEKSALSANEFARRAALRSAKALLRRLSLKKV